jgi:hypothetical protein
VAGANPAATVRENSLKWEKTSMTTTSVKFRPPGTEIQIDEFHDMILSLSKGGMRPARVIETFGKIISDRESHETLLFTVEDVYGNLKQYDGAIEAANALMAQYDA